MTGVVPEADAAIAPPEPVSASCQMKESSVPPTFVKLTVSVSPARHDPLEMESRKVASGTVKVAVDRTISSVPLGRHRAVTSCVPAAVPAGTAIFAVHDELEAEGQMKD
jgi:hypothetical protein